MSDFETPWTITRRAPLPMEFSRQEYWSGGKNTYSRGLSRPWDHTDVPDPGIESVSVASPVWASGSFITDTTW